MVLLGRPAELAQCQEALAPGEDGAAAVVITGAPGIGKTSLWRSAAAALAGDAALGGQPAVLRTTALPARHGGLGHLADLFDPVAEALLLRLPAPQAGALRAAFGLSAETLLGETLLERAVVTALRDLAEDGVVVAIDDEQWLDDDTRQLMQAAVVRLTDAPIRWLVAVRAGHEDQGLVTVLEHELGPRVKRLDLAGLDDGALSDLIGQRFPGPWSPTVLRRVVMLAAGSPYAALELARETVARGGHDGTAVHLPSTLADSLRSRLERLHSPALAVVQAAALAGQPTRALLAAVVGAPIHEQVDEALEAGVLEATAPDPVLRFSHPLLRETAEGMLTGPARRRLHRLIGAALDDPDEAAWQLACAADEPEEALAQRLDEAVARTTARGATARSAELARSAVELTPDPNSLRAWTRRLTWLERLVGISEFEQAKRLSEQWAPAVPTSLRGKLSYIRAEVEPGHEACLRLYAEAFADLAGQDAAYAVEAGIQVCLHLGFHLAGLQAARSQAEAVVAEARASADPILLRKALAMAGSLAALAGEPGAGDQLLGAARLPGFSDTLAPFNTPESALGRWHTWRGEVGPAREMLRAVIDVAEQHGSEESVNLLRVCLVEAEWRAGTWDAAEAHAAGYARWSRQSGDTQPHIAAYLVSLVESGRGDLDRARALAARGAEQAEALSDLTFALQCRGVLGQLELSVDDPAAALRWLEPIADALQERGVGEPGGYPFTPDLIEAWAATGQVDRAADRLAWLQDAARRLDHPWARITAGRAEAAVRLAERDPAAAVAAVSAVIPEARQRRLPFELGRCLLMLGTAQRKARQRRNAAGTLDEAAAVFAGLGAARWQALVTAQQTRLTPGDGSALTATEQRITELVAAGHTNPEIAAALFISVKTVEANLTRVYRKLGLRGRVELARHSFG